MKADDTARCECEENCGEEIKPVCGSDDKTYQNECELKHRSCLKKKPILATKNGPCSKIHIFMLSLTYIYANYHQTYFSRFREFLTYFFVIVFQLEIFLDLVFALDGSQSVGKEGFNNIKNLVVTMLDNYNISEGGTHVGVIEFSNQANVVFPLNQLFDSTLIKDQVQRIVSSGGKETVTDEVLRKSANEVFDIKSGGRPGASKVLIIITDGKSTGDEPPKRAVKPVKEKGVRVYVVNIGEDTDKDELEDIVPTEKNIYPAKTTTQLPSIAPKLVENIDKDIKKRKSRVHSFS